MPDNRSNVTVMLNLNSLFQITADSPPPERDGQGDDAPVETRSVDNEQQAPSNFCRAQPVMPDESVGLRASGPTDISPAAPPDATPWQSPEFSPLRVLDGTARFNGDCEVCRPYCGALCCKGYTLVHLSEAEAMSGRYAYTEASDDCTCPNCALMRDLNLKYNLWKKADGSCYYLTEDNYCGIHTDRPEACRMYSCANVAFRIGP